MGRNEDERNLQDPSPSSSFSSLGGGGPALLTRKLKFVTAISVYYANVVFGCAVNTYGPALTSFEKKYGTDSETISRVLSFSTGGLLVGALSSGIVFKYVNRQLAVAAFMGGMAVTMFLTPFCPNLTTFFVSGGVMGLFSGFYGTAQFVWIMEMFQKDCPPYVQSQHFFYALGTILSTLVMAPFLDKEKDVSMDIKMGAERLLNLTITDEEFSPEMMNYNVLTENQASSTNSKLFVPFTIVGSLLLVSSLMQILLFTFFRYHPPPPEVKNEDEQISQNPAENSNAPVPNSAWPKIRLVILSCCFLGAFQAMENCTLQFLPKFGQNSDLKLSESESTYVVTGLTASYAAARFVCIFIVFKVPSQLLLCGNIVITTVANILLTVWAKNSLPVLWTASIMYGLGFSSGFASYSAYIERYLQVTDGIGALIMVVGSGMSAGYPLIIGKFIEGNPVILGYTTFISIAICLVTFGTSSHLTHKDKTRY